MSKLTSSLIKAEKISSQCKKSDLACQMRLFFQSVFDDLSVHPSTSCNFGGVRNDPNGNPYIRGDCIEKGRSKECMKFTQSSLNSLCYDECEKKGMKLKQSACYRKDIICRCKKID